MSSSNVIAVCIDDHPKTPVILRAAQRKARETGIDWIAVHVETPARYPRDEEARERMMRFLMLAEQMGGAVRKIVSRDVFRGIAHVIEESISDNRPICHLIVGRTSRDGLIARLNSGLGDRLANRFRRKLEVTTISLTAGGNMLRWWALDRFRQTRSGDVLLALAAVVLAAVLSESLPLLLHTPPDNFAIYDVPAIFLVACMFASARVGFFAGLVATGLSSLCIVYATIGARHETGGDPQVGDFVNTLLFCGAGLLISLFGSHARASAEGAYRREKRTQALFKINRLTANAQSREEALGILHDTLTDLLDMEVAFFLPPALNPDAIGPAYPAGLELDDQAKAALYRCWKETTVTGDRAAPGVPLSWRFEPLVTPSGEIGVMGIHIARRRMLDASFNRLLGSIADHSAAIIERVELARMSEATRIREEREKLRSMLLSSVSHDLKTPLASVIGSLSVYHSMRDSLPEERRQMLTQTALDEAQRLDSFISNILDMTRLESGEITAKPEWAEPLDTVMRVKKRLRQRLRNHRVEVHPSPERIEVEMDVMLTEQVLGILLDNAAKYAPADSQIEVSLLLTGDGFAYRVRDHGPGIPEEKAESVFDKYSRLKREDSQVAGTGLGLAISRSIMELQGGTVTVANHPAGGAVFTIGFRSVRHIDEEFAEIVA